MAPSTLNSINSAEFIQLGYLGDGDWNEPVAISDDGLVVVGRSEGADGGSWPYRWTRDGGMAWLNEGYSTGPRMSRDGSLVTLVDSRGDFGHIWTEANGTNSFENIYPNGAISDDGGLVPMEITDPVSRLRTAAVWNADTGVTPIPPLLGYLESRAWAVSGNGQALIGTNHINRDVDAFLWTAEEGVFELGRALSDNNYHYPTNISSDGSVLFGNSTVNPTGVPDRLYSIWRWTKDSGIELLHEATIEKSLADTGGHQHLSSDGSTFVGTLTDNIDRTGTVFRWTERDGFDELPHFPGYTASRGEDMTPDASWILGTSHGSIDEDKPEIVYWLWNEQDGMRNIFEILTQQGLGAQVESWEALYVNAISGDARAILGSGRNPNGDRDAWVAYLDPIAIPEPSSLLLTTAGLACVLLLHKRVCGED